MAFILADFITKSTLTKAVTNGVGHKGGHSAQDYVNYQGSIYEEIVDYGHCSSSFF